MRTRASIWVFFRFIAAALIWEAVSLAPTWADTVTIQPPQADASLDENSPNTNRSSGPVLNVRSWAAGDFRVLVRFDLSSITPGTAITSADLELCLDRISGDQSTRTYGAHRVTKSWVEGEVTANQASNGVPWDTFFGDFAPATNTVNISKVNLTDNPDRFISWDVTADVQGFVNGTLANNGWLIKDQSENKSAQYRTDWISKESTSTVCGPSSTPRLRIVSSSGTSIAISSPTDGSIIERDTILVLGQVNAPGGVQSVTVNGIAAQVNEGVFGAIIPLQLGANTVTATLTEPAGNTTSQSILVTRQEPTTPDFFALWTGFKDALRNGDVEGALTFVVVDARERYRGIFTALGSQLSDIDSILTDITLVIQREDEAEFEMMRSGRSFQILFTRDDDGVWRLASL